MTFAFELPTLIDVVLAIVAVEFVALALLRRRLAGGLTIPQIAANLAAGACLLMVARAGLRGNETEALMWLAAAGLAHVIDLAGRLR